MLKWTIILIWSTFFNYHALFRMSPMDELPVPSDWPTTSKFAGLKCCLENARIFFFKFDSLWFCTSFSQPQEIYVTMGVAGGGGFVPLSGRQSGLQNEYFKWKHDFFVLNKLYSTEPITRKFYKCNFFAVHNFC